MFAWFLRHLQTLVGSLGELSRNPFSTILSVSVIAIALALPGGLFAALENINKFTDEFEHGAKISLFLSPEINIQKAKDLQTKLVKHQSIKHIELITPERAMKEFKSRSGLEDALNSLSKNPLPVVLLAYPEDETARSPAKLANLIEELGKLEQVEAGQSPVNHVALQACTLCQYGVISPLARPGSSGLRTLHPYSVHDGAAGGPSARLPAWPLQWVWRGYQHRDHAARSSPPRQACLRCRPFDRGYACSRWV